MEQAPEKEQPADLGYRLLSPGGGWRQLGAKGSLSLIPGLQPGLTECAASASAVQPAALGSNSQCKGLTWLQDSGAPHAPAPLCEKSFQLQRRKEAQPAGTQSSCCGRAQGGPGAQLLFVVAAFTGKKDPTLLPAPSCGSVLLGSGR